MDQGGRGRTCGHSRLGMSHDGCYTIESCLATTFTHVRPSPSPSPVQQHSRHLRCTSRRRGRFELLPFGPAPSHYMTLSPCLGPIPTLRTPHFLIKLCDFTVLCQPVSGLFD
uniref:Uncharacterized protein n=1 Tax=Cacopsylla melanoneura TaxID=428564 RepID=A0A8D8VBK6_9HEMI